VAVIFAVRGVNLFWHKKQSEVEFLREQVKTLQAQVIALSGKHAEYLNTRITEVSSPLNGKVEEIKELTPEQIKAAAQLAKDAAYCLGGVA
jgi:predicted component of type VI protein secretion system